MGGVSMEWKEVRLGDVCSKIGSGATPSGGKEAYKGGDYHLIRSQNVLDFAFSKDGLASINDEQANKLKNVEIIQGDVLLNITGDSVARCCIVPSEILPARVNQHVAIIRPRKEELDNNYLLYYLQYNKRQLLQIASAGATRNAITKAMIENLILPCPKSLEDQCRIASILSSLDRKIELNNKINADLEEMAQAIFKNWFVDFEPFKDGKFVDSELGMIPEGWKVGSPYEYVKVVYGAPYKSAKFNDNGEGLPLIRIRDLKDCNPQFYTPEILPQTEYVNMGDIVAGMDAEFVPHIWKGKTGLLNQRVCKLMPQQTSISNLFVLYLMKPELEFVQSYKTGTTVSHLGKADIDKFVVVLPPLKVVEECSKILDSILQRIKNISAESRTLSLLRDTLLPRLMSGELELPE